MDPIKLETSAGPRAFKRIPVFDGIQAMQLGGIAALRVIELLQDEETQKQPGAMVGIVSAAPEFVQMCGALVGMAWQGDDLEVKRGSDLAAYGGACINAAEAAGLSFTDVIMAGVVLYVDVQRRVDLDKAAIDRANFTARIRDVQSSST